MQNKALKIINLILAVFLAVFSISYVFAWFADGTKVTLNINGQASAYFAYGNGTQKEPFGITQPIHIYNMSWLQNSGKFADNQYFEISSSVDKIDMTGYYIAPIGNVVNRFTGIFNGNGKTISNLKVTTNKILLRSNDPAKVADYAFSNAVGFFGKTGDGSEIKNFILDNPAVEVESTSGGNTNYYDTTATGAKEDKSVVGLAVGEDNGSTTTTAEDGTTTTTAGVSNIGVIGGTLSVQRPNYTTVNSIIGKTVLKGQSVSTASGGDTGYLDPTSIHGFLKQEMDNVNNGGTSGYVRSISSDSDLSNSTTPFVYYSAEQNGNRYTLANKIWLMSSDSRANGPLKLGAFSLVSTYNASLTSDAMVIDYASSANDRFALDDSAKYFGNINSANSSDETTNSNNSDEITDGDTKRTINSYVINPTTNNAWSGTFNYYLRTGGNTGNTLGTESAVYAENGNRLNVAGSSDNTVAGSSDNTTVNLKSRTIRMDIVNAANSSILIIASANRDNLTTTITISKSSHNSYPSYEDDYDTTENKGFSTSENGIFPSNTKYTEESIEDIKTYSVTNQQYLTVIYHSLANSGAGAYAITFGGGSTRIYYMRVVGVTGTGQGSTEGNLDGIDFVQDDVTLEFSNNDYDFSATYTPTSTMVIFSTTAALILYYDRQASNLSGTYTIHVQYYGTNQPYEPTNNNRMNDVALTSTTNPFPDRLTTGS